MKFPLAPIAVSIVCVAQPVQADVSSDTAQIFELIAQLFLVNSLQDSQF